MKMIVAIVKPAVTEAVMDALADIGISGLTVSEVKGHGRQKGQTEIYRGAEYQVTLVPKVRFDIAVEDKVVEQVVDVIRKSASTGRIGDGKIFVLDLVSAVRIRTGEQDGDAINI
ncbi:MAG: P-II family nitrogen regulator [Alphaproteobacteria bacterium]|jgi:nitrogen regulatory protein PII|nr:transcriptional regulator [Rhodobiaceae bacterium]MBO6542725.1 P-II family nitrogen regulator [Alphaproteobacteria bacterium]MBO6628497.1 P-II family nitrogen regulator [Alphaproteobacteria bacterium]MDF1626160.1 P-II family nitrogen regulator [Parvibaculaceae bacterium]|tara:strand:- start:845 stop:1189 length:345 start_codon:yes stop_codon:yes gene_type:complete